jgi:dihydrofolate reductase
MAKLIYATNMSLDGYIEDANGSFDWGAPSEQLHSFFNDLLRPIGTHLYGRANTSRLPSLWRGAKDHQSQVRSASMQVRCTERKHTYEI